jgi:hypothetical protein
VRVRAKALGAIKNEPYLCHFMIIIHIIITIRSVLSCGEGLGHSALPETAFTPPPAPREKVKSV